MSVLSSYRWRRRLLWTAVFLAVATGAATLVLSLPGGKSLPPETFRDEGPVTTVAESKPLRVTSDVRREVNATLVPFVRHAVARRDPEAAWGLVTPALRTGTTREQWRRGDLPVFPFPARVEEATGWRVIEAFEDDLLIGLVIHARPETKRGAIAFQIELKRLGRGENRRWLVESIIPERTYAPSGQSARSRPGAQTTPVSDPTRGRLSPIWFLVPAALLSLIVLVPATILVVNWRRGARADRAYRRQLQRPRQ